MRSDCCRRGGSGAFLPIEMLMVTQWIHGEHSQPAPDSTGLLVLQARHSHSKVNHRMLLSHHIPQKWSFTCKTVRAESAELIIVHLEDFNRWGKCWDAAEPVAIQIQLLQKRQTLDQIIKIKQNRYFNSLNWKSSASSFSNTTQVESWKIGSK